jgi:hypothetical protein
MQAEITLWFYQQSNQNVFLQKQDLGLIYSTNSSDFTVEDCINWEKLVNGLQNNWLGEKREANLGKVFYIYSNISPVFKEKILVWMVFVMKCLGQCETWNDFYNSILFKWTWLFFHSNYWLIIVDQAHEETPEKGSHHGDSS